MVLFFNCSTSRPRSPRQGSPGKAETSKENMRVKRQNSRLYIIESFRDVSGRSTSRTVESLGTLDEIRAKYGCDDPVQWARNRAQELTLARKEQRRKDREARDALTAAGQDPLGKGDMKDDEATLFNYGSLYLQKMFYVLKLNRACEYMTRGTSYNSGTFCNAVRSATFGMLLWPSSHLSRWRNSRQLIDFPEATYDQMLDCLGILEENADYIHKFLLRVEDRLWPSDSNIYYLDCTNFYHCTDYPDEDVFDSNGKLIKSGFRKTGPSKENQNSPLTGLAAVVDSRSIPRLFIPYAGNVNEQNLYPVAVEKMHGMGLSNFKLCADAGLSSLANRALLATSQYGDKFITVLPIRKKGDDTEKAWYLDTEGWSWKDDRGVVHGPVSIMGLDPEDKETSHRLYYKEGTFVRCYVHAHTVRKDKDGNVIKEITRDGKGEMTEEEIAAFLRSPEPKVEERRKTVNHKDGSVSQRTVTVKTFLERVVVTFSMASRKRQRKNREKYESAAEMMTKHPYNADTQFNRKNKYLREDRITESGEVATIIYPSVDRELIAKEEAYDGFYAVATCDMEASTEEIMAMNKGRWRDEDLFRMGKTLFEVRPMFVRTEEHIKGHLMVYLLASTIFTLLLLILNKGRKEGETFSQEMLMETLRGQALSTLAGGRGYCVGRTNPFPEVTAALNSFGGIRVDRHELDPGRIRLLIQRSKAADMEAK